MFIIIDRFTRFEEITCIKRVTLGTLNEQRPRREVDILYMYIVFYYYANLPLRRLKVLIIFSRAVI